MEKKERMITESSKCQTPIAMIENTITHYHKLIECEQFVITGSLALHYIGFEVNIHDIDIVLVNPKEESLSVLKRLEKQNPSSYSNVYPEGNIHIYSETLEMNIDFFIVSKNRPTIGERNGILISNIKDLINAKKNYKRGKDILQLMNLSNQIITGSEIEEKVKRLNF